MTASKWVHMLPPALPCNCAGRQKGAKLYSRQSQRCRTNLRHWDHIGAEPMISNSPGHCQHTHDTVSIPIEHLASRLFNTLLRKPKAKDDSSMRATLES
jgi:hypothetical protein